MAKFLGIDVGTSGVKALLVDESGRILKQASAEYPISVPRPLWSEQNPVDWWNGVQAVVSEIGERHPDAVGLTGQMHGSVFLDAEDAVIRPAILWNDQRTSDECAEIDRVVGADRVRAITCNPPLTGFQAPKILWLRNNEPDAYARIRSVLLPKDFIRLMLTGEKRTEVSDASGTGLFDVPRRTWSDEMLRALDLPREWFPEAAESAVVTARTNGSGGLAAGIPVVGGGGDQAAGAVGTGAVVPGIVSVSLGTSGVVFTAIDAAEYDSEGAAHTFCHANNGWHAMGVMLSCGGAVRWYRDTFSPGSDYGPMNESAAAAPAGCDGLTFLPYLTGERCPHPDPLARAGFVGLTLGHGPQDMARSVFEGVSFGLREGFDLLAGLGATAYEVRVTGGGAKSPFWLQMIADVFARPCVTLEVDEGPAFGSAILAGVGIGCWPDVATACRQIIRRKAEVQPSGTDYGEAFGRYRSLYGAVRPWFRGESS
ncbi:MAG: xylulokinase [Fimbriimonadaceae bacterium]